MLQRPTRPLPRKFNRTITKSTRTFVERRHQRRKKYKRERWTRMMRRIEHTSFSAFTFLRRWLWVTFAGAALIGVGILIFSPAVHVREIHIRRTDPRLNAQQIEQALRPIFGRHLFFLSARDVQSLVQDAMPDTLSVSVEKNYPSSITLTVVLHPLVARLQIERPDATASASGALASRNGAVTYDYLTDNGLFISLPSVPKTGTLPLIRVVDWAARPVPSTLLMSPELLKSMQLTEQSLTQQFAMKVTDRTVFLRAREFHLRTAKFSLWFDMKSPMEDQLTRLQILLKSVGPNEVKEYVDLRLTGRIVFK